MSSYIVSDSVLDEIAESELVANALRVTAPVVIHCWECEMSKVGGSGSVHYLVCRKFSNFPVVTDPDGYCHQAVRKEKK